MYFKLGIFLVLLICFIIYYKSNKVNSNKINSSDINEGFSSKIKKFKSSKNKFKNIGSRRSKKEKFENTDKEDFYNLEATSIIANIGNNIKNNSNNSKNNISENLNYNNLIKGNNNISMSSAKNKIYNYYKRFDDEKFTRKTKSVIDSFSKWRHFKDELYYIFQN